MFHVSEQDRNPFSLKDKAIPMVNDVEVTIARVTNGRVTLEIVQTSDCAPWEIGELRGFFFSSFD